MITVAGVVDSSAERTLRITRHIEKILSWFLYHEYTKEEKQERDLIIDSFETCSASKDSTRKRSILEVVRTLHS